MSIFTTFGSFSIAAGILLIFLIFVMLSAERRTRARHRARVGTRREHLVQMFVFEGLAYDLGAAAVGAALGVAVAFAMVLVWRRVRARADCEIERAVSLAQPRHRLRARRPADVRRRRAVRLAREPHEHRRRGPRSARAARAARRPPPRSVLGAVGLALGVALAGRRASSRAGDAVLARPLARDHQPRRRSRAPPACRSGSRSRSPGLALLVWWLLPFDAMSEIAGRELSMDFSAWIVSGLMLVAGATWLIVYNADVLLGGARCASLGPHPRASRRS